jgi:hypothetical protein
MKLNRDEQIIVFRPIRNSLDNLDLGFLKKINIRGQSVSSLRELTFLPLPQQSDRTQAREPIMHEAY